MDMELISAKASIAAKGSLSEKTKFEKRLNTYLKKYGTSKLRSWSYWSEE